MRLLLAWILTGMFAAVPWHYNMDEAKAVARKEHKYILLNFSGSDWCGPCIRMHEEIFEQAVFLKMADSSLVLVNADFPRQKQHQLAPAQQKMNDAMADQYNQHGDFPLTVLLDADGRVLKSWNGLPPVKAEEFARQVRKVIEQR